jgi:hypothetical protein
MGKQMTDDLVKRLRGLAGRTVDLPTHYEMTEAADRIEELQARVEWAEGYLRGALDVVETLSHADTSKARAALEGKHG